MLTDSDLCAKLVVLIKSETSCFYMKNLLAWREGSGSAVT